MKFQVSPDTEVEIKLSFILFWVISFALVEATISEVSGLVSSRQAALLSPLLPLSLIIHELGHAAIAHKKGLHVKKVKLSFLVSSTELESPVEKRNLAWVASGGPIATLIIVVLSALATVLFSFIQRADIASVMILMGLANLTFLLINLIPINGLDGYSVLKGYFWENSEDEMEALDKVRSVSRKAAWVIVGLGFIFQFIPAVAIGLFIYWANRS